MQHRAMTGTLVGSFKDECFEDRMRRIRGGMLHAAALRAPADSPWMALRVMTGRELAVEKLLRDADIEAAVPMRKGPVYRRRGREIPAKMMPVMTGYVLVRCMVSDHAIVGLRGIEHVIDMLGGSERPHLIPDTEVKRFNDLAAGGALDWEKPTHVFAIGWKVGITDGPFAGFGGSIISCRNDGRGDAVVEINLFGRMTPVLVPLAILQRL